MEGLMARTVRIVSVLLLTIVACPAVVLAQPDGAATRLFFWPTGRLLAPGEVYVAAYGAIIPAMQAGITSRFSVGGGAFPAAIGHRSIPFWVTPKVQVYASDRTSVAAGLIHGLVLGVGSGGYAYVVSTTETTTGAYTVGAFMSYARSGGEGAAGAPAFQFGGEHRASRRVTVVSENYISRHAATFLLGVRLHRNRLSVDLGGGAAVLSSFVTPAALVNLAWRFGPARPSRSAPSSGS
jgi:hypothetical protein